MGRGRQLAKLDMYRKVPMDLVEGSQQGNAVSWLAILVILGLFYKETADFLTTRLSSKLTLDKRTSVEEKIMVTFNITMMDLKCDFVEVDVVSVLGINQNATKFIKKFPLDANGVLNTMVRIIRRCRPKAARIRGFGVTKCGVIGRESLPNSGGKLATGNTKS